VKNRIKCSIVGARGYAGLETARLLLSHPHADLTHCFATSSFDLPLTHPRARKVVCLADSEILNHVTDVVFLATPAEVSMELAPKLLGRGLRVIDLSGAFRLKFSDYAKWYGFAHTESAALAGAVYGLAPFAGPSKGEKLIANPGCYATAIELALIPLLRANVIEASSIVIDAKSGTTGAGKKASEAMLYSEVEGECRPYKIGQHQHYPEIVEACEQFAGVKIDAHMSTSLLPLRRGIIAGIYAKLKADVDEQMISDAFTKAFEGYPLVEVGRATPDLMSLKRVVGTGRTQISYSVDGQKLYVFSVIDNLMKGAASQAVENFNRLTDQPIATGLTHLEALI
jgi:N-acetyl-gamma-glutamyl-phosphate reductase